MSPGTMIAPVPADIRADTRSVTMGAVAMAIMLSVFLALFSLNAWQLEKTSTLTDLKAAAEVQSRTLDAFFQHSQRSLKRLREALFDADGHMIGAQDQRAVLQRALDDEPDWATANIVTTSGKIVVSTGWTLDDPPAVTAGSPSDRGFSISLSELRDGVAMSIGRGLIGPLTKTWVAPLRYGVRDRAGALVDLLVATMPLDRPLSVWEAVSFPPGGGVGIMRVDEAVFLIARYPLSSAAGREEVYGTPRPGDFAKLLLSGAVPASGTYDGFATLPAMPTLWGYARLRDYPLVFFIQAPKTLLWERWWASVWLTYLLFGLLLIGGYATYRWIIRDVTARRQAEAALEEARRVADTANRAKSEFVARMSHELRTPLNAVIGFGELLSHDLTMKQREFSRYIVQAGRHLLSIVNDILDLAHSDRGQLELAIERVEVQDAFDYVATMLRPEAENARIVLEISVPADLAAVSADDQRLRRILMNLVANAIRYNRPGGSAVLSALSVREGWIRLVVTDTGLGIDPERRATLFEPFNHRGSAYSAESGMGIGLALSLRLAEAMGGSIGFTSQPGHGSTFWIELPAA